MHEGRGSLSGISFHLSSKRGPGLIRAAGTNREIDAGTLKNDVTASISPQLPGEIKEVSRMMADGNGRI